MSSKRVDQNHPDIVAALRGAHCSVVSLAAIGKGCPDLLVGHHAFCCRCQEPYLTNTLLEIKNPAQRPSDRRLTPDEQRFSDNWRGQLAIALTIEEALAAVGRKAE